MRTVYRNLVSSRFWEPAWVVLGIVLFAMQPTVVPPEQRVVSETMVVNMTREQLYDATRDWLDEKALVGADALETYSRLPMHHRNSPAVDVSSAGVEGITGTAVVSYRLGADLHCALAITFQDGSYTVTFTDMYISRVFQEDERIAVTTDTVQRAVHSIARGVAESLFLYMQGPDELPPGLEELEIAVQRVRSRP